MSERRERILDAARGLIVRDGYAGASMHAIARAAGITRPALYAEFADRDELFEALLEREAERVLAMSVDATPELTPDDDPVAVAERAVDVFLDLVASAPETWRLVFMRGDGMPPATYERIERGREGIRQQTHLLLGMLSVRGEQRIDTELLSHGVISVSETAARLLVHDPSVDRAQVSSTLRWMVRRTAAHFGIAEGPAGA
ncbi:TetR/AcrR family transcriptional regulator [Nocardia sp. 2]|uniref:TetR/AcrR family transcriptional regulator n=1 Tax=Nocardia acididurans TaxID=2802282 RepID=A0ABS1M130_9NOCA|nr:TetR/AcrR family transcriptional regulator [Nocardia acididurans]MBL1074240.1 TetR/AcrR family transcriptional regulator [Nocardia acididurans]